MLFTASAMWFTIWGWHFWQAYPWIRVPAVIFLVVLFYGISGYTVVREYIRHHRRKQARVAAAEEGAAEAEDSTDEQGPAVSP